MHKKKLTRLPSFKRQRARIYKYKGQKQLRNILIYKKPDTFQKAGQLTLRFYIKKERHFTLRNVSRIFLSWHYIQKAQHFALCEVFTYKKPDTSQKARQFALRLYIYKARHFMLYNF